MTSAGRRVHNSFPPPVPLRGSVERQSRPTTMISLRMIESFEDVLRPGRAGARKSTHPKPGRATNESSYYLRGNRVTCSDYPVTGAIVAHNCGQIWVTQLPVNMTAA
ncbi:hypothetical protein JCM13591A_32040 [Microbacterium xylanilyticum]